MVFSGEGKVILFRTTLSCDICILANVFVTLDDVVTGETFWETLGAVEIFKGSIFVVTVIEEVGVAMASVVVAVVVLVGSLTFF